ncbi:hypothetical protein COCNU_scaffold000258G000050 [Cocos nucifera]|nr:hypothetical protein [Cocos nucifera]
MTPTLGIPEGLRLSSPEIDVKAIKMLSKRLQAHKKKEVIPTAMVGIAVENFMPPNSVSSPTEDLAPQSHVGREEVEKKKAKRVVVKVHRMVHPSGSNGNDDSPREDPFSDPNLI